MNITIVGSGNIAHALIACLNLEKTDNIFVLTSKVFVSDIIKTNLEQCKGSIDVISNNPSEVIPKSDLIILTVPAHIRKSVISKISPFIRSDSIIGSFPGVAGFNEEVEELIKVDINIFASQRVPYISRIQKKGFLVNVDKKDEIYVAIKYNSQSVKNLLEKLLGLRVNILNSFLEVNLSNSNPILHSARLYDIITNSQIDKGDIYFYKEWTDNASKILLAMDDEFMQIVKQQKLNIKSLKEHYAVANYNEMTQKIKSIKSFQNIKVPIIRDVNRNILDISSRYFTEDIDKSLFYIKEYAKIKSIDTPNIDKVFNRLKKYKDSSL